MKALWIPQPQQNLASGTGYCVPHEKQKGAGTCPADWSNDAKILGVTPFEPLYCTCPFVKSNVRMACLLVWVNSCLWYCVGEFLSLTLCLVVGELGLRGGVPWWALPIKECWPIFSGVVLLVKKNMKKQITNHNSENSNSENSNQT